MRIARHKIASMNWFKKRYEQQRRLILVSLQNVSTRCGNLDSIVSIASELFALGVLLKEESTRQKWYLDTGAKAALALFKKFIAGNDSITTDLDGSGEVSISGTIDPSIMSPGTWEFGFYLATIGKTKKIVDDLCEIPPHVYRTTAKRVVPEYKNLLIDAIIFYLKGKPNVRKVISNCIEVLESEKNSEVKLVYLPVVRALESICFDQPSFNEILEDGLSAYKQMIADRPQLKKGVANIVAIRLLGMAALAHQVGIRVTVESDYLPTEYANGTF